MHGPIARTTRRASKETSWRRRRESNPRPSQREESDGARLLRVPHRQSVVMSRFRVPWSPPQSWRYVGDGPRANTSTARTHADYPPTMTRGHPSSLLALLACLEDAHSRPAAPPSVLEACPSPSPLASTGPATPSAPSSTGCSTSTRALGPGVRGPLRSAGRVAAQGRSHGCRVPLRLRPARRRLRADPLSELPGQTLGAVRRARHHRDPRAGPAPPRRADDPARAMPAARSSPGVTAPGCRRASAINSSPVLAPSIAATCRPDADPRRWSPSPTSPRAEK